MLQQSSPVCSYWLSCGRMTQAFFCFKYEDKGKKHTTKIYTNTLHKDSHHTHETHSRNTQQTSLHRGVCPAGQKLLTHSKKWEAHSSRGCGRFSPLMGSRMWMLWENICGRGCCELSCTARTRGLGMHRGRGGGLKKAEPEVWWVEWCVFFPPFSSLLACFLSEDAAICWHWWDECRQGTGRAACLF